MTDNFVDYGNATALMGGVADRIEKDKFIGTKNDWKQLSSEEKAVYDGRIVNITDDFTPGGGGGGGSYTPGDGIDIANDEISVKTDSSTTFINSDGEVEGLAPDANDFDVNTTSKTVKLDPSQRVYTGTRAAWDELSTAEKTKYGIAHFTDDLATQGDAIVVDVVEEGNLNAVTSNAVAEKLAEIERMITMSQNIYYFTKIPAIGVSIDLSQHNDNDTFILSALGSTVTPIKQTIAEWKLASGTLGSGNQSVDYSCNGTILSLVPQQSSYIANIQHLAFCKG